MFARKCEQMFIDALVDHFHVVFLIETIARHRTGISHDHVGRVQVLFFVVDTIIVIFITEVHGLHSISQFKKLSIIFPVFNYFFFSHLFDNIGFLILLFKQFVIVFSNSLKYFILFLYVKL